ncbi:hypothetical protein [Sporosarcina sp. A2]|uniref:hypothetical protein n=1 Tax=Sporosarcina sp. A2 TaxID=3393449 RepID=UPI003D7A5FB2
MLQIIIPVMIGIVITLIFSLTFKKSEKVDKGFKVNYFNLSYRRKMIRSLTSLPISILALIFIFIYADWSMLANVIFSFLFITAYSGQVLYNFFMWKKVEA